MFVCPLKGFKTNGQKNADLCDDQARFVLPTEIPTSAFSGFLKGEACLSPQYWACILSRCI